MKRLMLTLFAVVFGFATADAQITQGRIGNGDITIYGTEWNDVYGLDIDNDGILEIRISDFESTPTIYNGAFSYDYEDNGTNILADENMWDYVAVLDAGVTVGAGNSSLFAGYGDAYFDGSNISVGTHYLAFRIKLDDGLHYAWAEYTMTEESGNYRATFNACYYNATVGADIVTGDTGSDSCMMTAPFSENFDALTSGIPDCWTQEASNSARAEWTYDATGHSGSCLSFGDWYGENSRLIFPAVDCSALTGGAQLSLCYKNPAISNGNKATLALYYRTSDSGEWIAVDGFSITTATEEWTCVEILLPNSTAAPYYQLSLVATGYNTYPRVYAYIDDIVVGAPSACPRPSDFAAIPTDNSLTLSWTENGSATAWQLKVGDDEWLDVTDNPYTLDHLTANTSYTVQVRSNCGGGDLSLPVSVSTRTLCSTQTIPYNEPFTGHETGVAPACWTTVVASDTYPKVVNTASYATDGNYLELYGSYSSHVSFIASPILESNANTLYLSFDAWLSNYSRDTLYVGVMDNPADASTFTSVFSLVGNQNGGSWTNYEINLSAESTIATSTAKYIAFRFYGSSDYGRIDNIVVSEPPACAKPVNLTLDGATDISLTLSWIEAGSATKWVVKVGDGAWTETTDNPYTIDGLAANTEYAVTVRAFCDPDTSDAVSGSFRTACAAQSVPYSENFDAMTTNAAPSCWTVALAYSNYSGSYPYVATSAANGGSGNGLYFYASSSNSNIIATPMLDRNANGCLVAFDARLANYSVVNLHVGVMSDPSDASTFEGVYTINGSDNAATWQPYEIDLSTFDAIASSDAKYIAFKFDGSNDYCYLDNLSVSIPLPCKKPTDLAATPTANSLELSWTENGTADQWLVKVDDGDYQLTSDNPYTVTGLAPSSTYTVEVRAYCGEGDTSYAVVGTFNTDCAIASVPYNEDFEGITSGLPNCWQQDATNETRSKWNFTADGREGNAVFFEDFWAESSRLIVVPVDCSSLTTDGVIRFAYKRTLGSSDTYVTATAYYRTAADGEWTAIDGWSLSETMDEWNDVELTLPASANAPYYQVSILATGEDTYTPKPGLYIDNLYIGPASDTPEPPSCDVPTGLTVSDITATSAIVSWTDVELPAADEGFIGDWTLNMDENAQIHRTLTLDPSLHSALSGFGNDIPDADEDASVAGNEMTMSITAATGDQVNVTGTFSLEVTDGVTLPFNYSTTGTVTASGLNIEPADLTQSATLYNIMPVSFTGTLTFAQPTALPDNGTLTVGIASIDIDGAGSVSMGFVSGNATMSITGNGITAAGSKDAADANQATYELVLVNTATDVETNITTSDNPYSFENLTAETDYTVKIRTLCAENNTSDWSDAVPFTTLGEEPASCDVPTALDVTNVTASSAVISWTGNAPQYELEINGQTTTVASAPYIAQGLSAETDYSVRVRAICDNDIASDWTSTVTFTTLDNGGQEPESCATPVNVAVSSVTTNSAVVTWQAGLANESFIGNWALNMSETDSVHMVITPDQGMHTLLQFVGYDIEDVDENVSIAGTVVPVSIEPATGDQVNVTGSFDMNMYGVDEPVTFNFATTGTLSNNTLTIEPASINETVRIMDAMPIDYTGSVVFVQPTALPVDGNLTLGIASLDINGYGDTTVSMGGYTMSGSVTISMTGSQLHATGPRSSESVDDQAYELVLTNTTTAVETNVSPASSPYTAQNLAPSTTYTVKVRALCDGGNTSEWSAPVSFTTLDENPQPEPCDAPSGVSVVNVTATTATVSWTGSASAYQIEVFASGQPITASASASPYTITGLSASTGYTVHVRAICDGGLTSDWSDAVSFTTLDDGQQTEPCDVPANLTITNVTATSFTASWSGTAGHYEVDFLQTLVEVAENNYSMQFLTPSTTYTIRVRALCDNGGVSEWSDVVSFTTLPEGGTQGIADVEAASGSICIYPNPASNQTTVSIDGFNGSATLNVIDMSGRTVVSAALTEGSAKLDVSHLAAGTYFVRVQGENLSAIRKLVVK